MIFFDIEDDVGWYLSCWDEIFEIDVFFEGFIVLDELILVFCMESFLYCVIFEVDRNEEVGDEIEV